jgi:2-oxoisovalerate dehydrogenase E1 component
LEESRRGAAAPPLPLGLSREQLLGIYRNIYLSRRVDDKEIQLKRQNRAYFQINGVGHEAVLTAAALALRPGRDWVFAYYRDRALCLGLGTTPYEMFLASVGAADDPSSGGRQMPSHWGNRRIQIMSRTSCTGTQFNQATGCAEASLYFRLEKSFADRVDQLADPDEVTYVSSGEGTTSQGEFWEALNFACNRKLPVLFLIEDNGYAISTPKEVNTAGGSISKLVRSFPDLFLTEVDGCDPIASLDALRYAVQFCRERKGPALVHAHVIRPYSHSLSDDEALYRPKAEREEEARRDPITTFPAWLIREGHATEEEIAGIRREVDELVQRDADRALAAALPESGSFRRHVYSESVDPTSAAFGSPPRSEEGGTLLTMVDSINACLRDEMGRDPRIVMFGEDVADATREGVLGEVKGKGGVFKATAGCQKKYGGHRVMNSPLSESHIVGRAIGLAMRGLKPVVEIQFLDYIWPAYMQIRNELATTRWRSNGAYSSPAVVRVAIGGYLTGGAMYHSQCGEVLFTHVPGLRVVFPSTAEDANGLLRTAIRCDDPVLFLEHKHLYRQAHNKGLYPGPDFMVPFGKAKTVLEGSSVTVVTYGATVVRSLQAAKALAGEGISCEILDLRSLAPWDREGVAASVRKTNRCVVVHEDTLSFGYGAEIAARIGEELFEHLDAPVARVGAADTFVAYQPKLEDEILPQPSGIAEAIRKTVRW